MIGRRALLRLLPMAPAAPALAAKAIHAAMDEAKDAPDPDQMIHGLAEEYCEDGSWTPEFSRAYHRQLRRIEGLTSVEIASVKSKRSWSPVFKAHVTAKIAEEKEEARDMLSCLMHEMGEEGHRKLAALLGVKL